jgi:hypothetical protein
MSNAQVITGATRTFTAGATIAAFSRVNLSSGELAVAGLDDADEVGFVTEACVDGDSVAVVLRGAQGTVTAIAAGAIAVGATLYTAASGKVNDVAASTSYPRGIALEAAAADGDYIEILPIWDETAVS